MFTNFVRHAARTGARHASSSARQSGSAKVTAAATALGAAALGAAVFVSPASAASAKPDLAKARSMISDIINDIDVVNPSCDDGAQGGGGGVAPMLLRLAWHSSGTWCEKSRNGGSEGGTMRFSGEASHGGNAGLGIARDLLEPVKAACPNLSYADLYVLSGVVAVEEMGGPAVDFRYGRSDAASEKSPAEDSRFSPDGRLPDGDKPTREQTIQHLRDIFYRMGFDDQAIVALSGAHAVGRCHTDRSGYWGPWTYAETTFSNGYFTNLLDPSQGWQPKTQHNGKPWTGPPQFVNAKGDLMMLHTDMALTWDPSFRKYVEIYAKDEERWMKDFAKYYQQLNELGCKNLSGAVPRFLFFGPKE